MKCLNDTQFSRKVGFFKYLEEEGVSDVFSLTLDELYTHLKQFKSISKKRFFEDLSTQAWYKDSSFPLPDRVQRLIDFINQDHPLFGKLEKQSNKKEDVAKKFLTYSDGIRTAQSNKERKDCKKKRGKIFQKKHYGFGVYVDFVKVILSR